MKHLICEVLLSSAMNVMRLKTLEPSPGGSDKAMKADPKVPTAPSCRLLYMSWVQAGPAQRWPILTLPSSVLHPSTKEPTSSSWTFLESLKAQHKV